MKEIEQIELESFLEFQKHFNVLRAPVKLTTSVRSKLTTCFAGEDLSVHVC